MEHNTVDEIFLEVILKIHYTNNTKSNYVSFPMLKLFYHNQPNKTDIYTKFIPENIDTHD